MKSLSRAVAASCALCLPTLVSGAHDAAQAAEIKVIGRAEHASVPKGKEVDAIDGDFLLRSDRISMTVGGMPTFRDANVNTQAVQGAVIDLARRDLPGGDNDMLVAFYPHGHFLDDPAATRAQIIQGRGAQVVLRVYRPARAGLQGDAVEATTDYILRDGEPFVRLRTTYHNPSSAPVQAAIYDKIRADGLFRIPVAGDDASLIYYDPWNRAAYGVVRAGGLMRSYANPATKTYGQIGGNRLDFPELLSQTPDAKPIGDALPLPSVLAANGSVTIERFLIPGRHPADVQAVVASLLQQNNTLLPVRVMDGTKVVAKATVVAKRDGKTASEGWTDDAGRVALCLPQGGDYQLSITQLGRASVEQNISVSHAPPEGRVPEVRVPMGQPALVALDVHDVTRGQKRGPVKVVFRGIEGTPNPDFGPMALPYQAGNICFSATGKFTAPLPPGQYELLIGRGAEYSIETRRIQARYGETVAVEAGIRRVVDSRNWVVSDLHNHTTLSNDSIADPYGRVVGIAASGIEFAPETEHNRISSFAPFIEREGLQNYLKSAGSIELSGRPGPGATNHQNGFPLRVQAWQQSGGAPRTDVDPRVQISRLFNYDNRAEKFVQHNHPDVAWLYHDKNRDGVLDAGFGTLPFTHAMEISRTLLQLLPDTDAANTKPQRSRAFYWLQMLNQDNRVYGTANSDAHITGFNNGSIFTYIRSKTDAPHDVDALQMAREAKRGHMVISNGPFLDVSLNGALPGDDVKMTGDGRLRVQVQCAPWMDINRVQVLVNGRQEPSLNWTRSTHPQWFATGTGSVRFNREIPLRLARDAHIIVVATGEGLTTGPFNGQFGDQAPTAMSNPIYVDFDGGGFRANGDTLGIPLPTKGGGAVVGGGEDG